MRAINRIQIRSLVITILFLGYGHSAIAQKYSDGRPEAHLRMAARDHGIVLQYGDGPDQCDILGARVSGYLKPVVLTTCTTMLQARKDGSALLQ